MAISAAFRAKRRLSASRATWVNARMNLPTPLRQQGLADMQRGAILLATLLRLHAENHGAAVEQELRELGLPLEDGTLYALLKRLEDQGLLVGRLQQHEGRWRRVHALTATGRALQGALHEQWEQLNAVIEALDRASVYQLALPPGRRGRGAP